MAREELSSQATNPSFCRLGSLLFLGKDSPLLSEGRISIQWVTSVKTAGRKPFDIPSLVEGLNGDIYGVE